MRIQGSGSKLQNINQELEKKKFYSQPKSELFIKEILKILNFFVKKINNLDPDPFFSSEDPGS